MHATIFGNVVSIVGRMYGRRAEYDKKVRENINSTQHHLLQVLDLEYFARLHKLPKDVRQRLISSNLEIFICDEAEQLSSSKNLQFISKRLEHSRLLSSLINCNHPGWWGKFSFCFRMVDHLQTKWFFNRGLDSKVDLHQRIIMCSFLCV